jgi:hypothetical protein
MNSSSSYTFIGREYSRWRWANLRNTSLLVIYWIIDIIQVHSVKIVWINGDLVASRTGIVAEGEKPMQAWRRVGSG